ncbi:hypothetical protein C8R44DRAFT_750764 [Mycena epipterygia]|nr:hypothetical protein C8R44DRAFT_750764 [Mycena epipterygia]
MSSLFMPPFSPFCAPSPRPLLASRHHRHSGNSSSWRTPPSINTISLDSWVITPIWRRHHASTLHDSVVILFQLSSQACAAFPRYRVSLPSRIQLRMLISWTRQWDLFYHYLKWAIDIQGEERLRASWEGRQGLSRVNKALDALGTPCLEPLGRVSQPAWKVFPLLVPMWAKDSGRAHGYHR